MTRLSDKYYGRKWIYFWSLFVQLLTHIIILISKNLHLNIFMYFIAGLCAVGRVMIGVNYMNEFIPVEYQNISTTWFPAGDAFVMIYQSIFYLFVPNWYYVHSVAILFAIVILYFNYHLPESPKYMYANRRYAETRQILKIVAMKNGAKITS